MFTERMYKEKGVKFSDELKKQTYYSRSYSINCIGWSGSDNKKKRYFQKHFYSSLKEMRRSKLKRINFLSEEKHEI